MRLFLALLYDSLLETLDRRLLYVLLVLHAVFIVLAASVGFEPRPVEEVIERRWGFIDSYYLQTGFTTMESRYFEEAIVVSTEVSPSGDGGYAVVARVVRPAAVREYAAALERSRLFYEGRAREAEASRPVAQGPLSRAEAEDFFRRLADEGLLGFERLEAIGEDRFRVFLRPPHPFEIVGAGRVTLGFGLLGFEIDGSYAELLLHMQSQIAVNLAGWVVVVVAVIVTAGFFPSMLEDGAIDLILSKPIRRSMLFLAKYLGGLFFIFINAVILIGGFWVAMSVRSGFYNFGFLLTIANVMALFASVYAVSVLFAVLTRSPAVAALASLIFWFFCSMARGTLTALYALRNDGWGISDWAITGVRAINYVLPSPADFSMLSIWCVSRAPISEAARERFLDQSTFALSTQGYSLEWSLASTTIFTLLVLGFTAWRFQKRDF